MVEGIMQEEFGSWSKPKERGGDRGVKKENI